VVAAGADCAVLAAGRRGFSALWDVVLAVSAPVVDFLRTLFEWKPLDQLIESWGPIVGWFGELWQKLQTVIAPIKELFDGGFAGLIGTGKVETLTEAQRQTNAEGKGELAPAFFARIQRLLETGHCKAVRCRNPPAP
jgi:hypothetical protein